MPGILGNKLERNDIGNVYKEALDFSPFSLVLYRGTLPKKLAVAKDLEYTVSDFVVTKRYPPFKRTVSVFRNFIDNAAWRACKKAFVRDRRSAELILCVRITFGILPAVNGRKPFTLTDAGSNVAKGVQRRTEIV
jgi:hypothetical protein